MLEENKDSMRPNCDQILAEKKLWALNYNELKNNYNSELIKLNDSEKIFAENLFHLKQSIGQ
jgi:hypothetical protein